MTDAVKNNPLRQYFRRPALYLKLPSGGKGYPAGAIDMTENGELPVYPMTAIDEITSRTPDALYNGVAVTEIIKSCVPNIKQPWEVLNIDMDPILVAIRIATNGQLMEVESTCPKCTESSKFDLNLTGVLGSFRPGDYDTPITDEDLQIKFKPLTYRQVNKAGEKQFEIQRILNQLDSIIDPDARNSQTATVLKDINEMALELMLETIEYIKTPDATVFDKDFIREFLSNCNKNLYNQIKDKNIELRKSTELKPLDVKCLHCGHEYSQDLNINITDFFD
jgi:RNase P subunit RPR2